MKKYLAYILSLFVLIISCGNLFAATPKAGIVNDKVKKVLKVRKKPNTKSDVKIKLDKGTSVEILKKKGKWFKIQAKQTKGWVKKKYIKVTEYKDEFTTSIKSLNSANNNKDGKKNIPNKNSTVAKSRAKKNN